MPQDELAGVSQPSMAAVLESIVGPWGSIFIRVGVIVSVLGAYLAWTLMAAEVLYIPAKTDDMPRFLARTNSHGAPVSALIMAAGLISLLLVALLFAADALDFMLDLTAALSLIPYLLAAAYALKLTVTRESYDDGKSLARRHGDRRGGDGVHLVPDLCRGHRQASAVVHLVRARCRALFQSAARTQICECSDRPRRCCSA